MNYETTPEMEIAVARWLGSGNGRVVVPNVSWGFGLSAVGSYALTLFVPFDSFRIALVWRQGAVLAYRTESAQKYTDDRGNTQTGDGQQDGMGQGRKNQGTDLVAGPDRCAQVPFDHPHQVVSQTNRHGFVQVEPGVELGRQFRCGPRAQHGRGRIAG